MLRCSLYELENRSDLLKHLAALYTGRDLTTDAHREWSSVCLGGGPTSTEATPYTTEVPVYTASSVATPPPPQYHQ